MLQEVFWHIKLLETGAAVPKDDAFDEVLSFTILVPLAFTNIRATLDGIVSCSDASLTGGGVAVAMSFRPFAAEGMGSTEACRVAQVDDLRQNVPGQPPRNIVRTAQACEHSRQGPAAPDEQTRCPRC